MMAPSTAETFTIRIASSADIPALEALIEQSVRVLQRNDYPPSQIDSSIGSAFGIDRQLLADRTYFVVAVSDAPATIVGCGGWSYRSTLAGSDQLADRNDAPLDPATDFAKIRAIFVHPDWARRGLGSIILKHCEEAAEAAGFCRFEMGSTLTGVALYNLNGYAEAARISIPLPNGEALAIVRMTKLL